MKKKTMYRHSPAITRPANADPPRTRFQSLELLTGGFSKRWKIVFWAFVQSYFTAATSLAATNILVQQAANYDNSFDSGGSFYDSGTTNLGMWANSGSKQTVRWRGFRQGGGASGSSSARSLQIGDVFTIEVRATRALGQIGVSLNTSPSATASYNDRTNGWRAYFNTDGHGSWYLGHGGGTTSYSYNPSQDTYRNYRARFKITSQTTADTELWVDGTFFARAYNISLNGSAGLITGYSVYGSDMWDGNSNDDAFWRQPTTVEDSGTVELGYFLTSGTFNPGLIADGLVATSGTSRANTLFVGGDSGTAVILDDVNTFTGAATINANATGRAQNNNAFGTTAGGVSVTSGGMIELSGGITIGAEALTLNGSGVSSAGALRNTSSNNNWQATVTLGSATRINSDLGTLTIDPASGNAITGAFNLTIGGLGNVTINDPIATSTGNLTKDGSGTLTLAASNSLTGGMILSGGTLSITNANALGGGQFNMGNAGTLVTLAVNANTTITNTFQIYNAAVNAVIDVANGATNVISGRLTQDAGKTNTTKFGKSGAGTLIFNNGANDYNGQIQIGQGTVILGTTNAVGTNITTAARGIDLGLNISDASQANNVSVLASNGVTVRQSIYVANNNSGATRTIGIAGAGTNTFNNEFYIDGILTVDAGANAGDLVNISGNIINTGGLNKVGAGSLALLGTNTFSGGVTLTAGTLAINSTNALGAAAGRFTIAGGTINNTTAGAITLANNNPQTWSNDFTFTGSQALNLGSGAVTLSASRSVAVNASTLTVGGIISGSGFSLAKTGAGTLALTAANTYSGGTLISGGTLSIGVGAAAGSVSGAITNNGILAFNHTDNITSANTITGTGALSKLGAGILTLTGNNSYSGGTLISAGVLTIGAGGTVGSITGAITNNSALVFNRSDSVNYSGVISGTGVLTNQGSGTLILSVSNSFSGAATIAAGSTIQLGNAGGLGTTAGGTTVNAGGVLDLNGQAVLAEPLTLNGTGISSGGALVNNSSTNASFSGAVSLASLTSIGGSGNISLGGIISGANALTKIGAGKLSFSNANTYSAGTLVSEGVLNIGAGGAAGAVAGNITNNASLVVDRSSAYTLSGNISGTGSLTLAGAGAITLGGVNTYSGATIVNAGSISVSGTGIGDNSAVTLASGTAMTVSSGNETIGSLAGAGNITMNNATLTAGGDNSSTTFSGAFIDQNGSRPATFVKQGTGTLTISGAPTHSAGFFVQAGSVNYNGTNTASAVGVASNAFLFGSGSVGALSVTGTVSAGAASNTVGTLQASSFSITNGARIQVDFSDMSAAAGTGWDLINVNAGGGTYTVGSNIVIALRGNPANFSQTTPFTNIIINAGTANGFATNNFTVDITEFRGGSAGGGTFTFDALNGDLRLIFRPQPLPDVSVSGNGVQIPTNDVSPSAADHTDFGDVLVDGGTLTRTFTITNSGSATLGLGTVTTSAVTGAASNFIVTAQPAASIAAGATTTFQVQFNPSTSGVLAVDVSFTNTVTNSAIAVKNPYTFRIQGTGTYVEVGVSGLGNNIPDGDVTPATTDGTDFGSVALTGGTQARTFVITNTGNRALGLGSVTVTGTHATNFVVTTQPTGPVAAGGSTSFVVSFDPSAVGTRTATLSFTNTDDRFEDTLLETPFDFAVQGVGVAPSITTFPATITFNSLLGSLPSPAFQTFSITNNGLGTMNWTLSTNATWLSVSNTSGTAAGGAGQVHTAFVGLVSGMVAGTSNATITVTSTEATNSPQQIAVSWTLSAITNPTAQTATADGNQLVRLAWTKNASHNVMIIHKQTNAPTVPTNGTAYSTGFTFGDGSIVIAANSAAATLEHVVPAGSTNFYVFYSINNNYYSPGVTSSVAMGTFATGEIVEPFGYTNGVTFGTFSGGNGFTNAWSVGAGSWTVTSGMSVAGVYPSASGNSVRLANPGTDGSGNAARNFAPVSTGTLYIAAIIRYGFDGASKWSGVDLSSNGTTLAYFGKDYTQSFRFGVESGGARDFDTGYNFNPADGGNGAPNTNNQYLIIARYNFDTDVLNGAVYYKTTAVPATEPTSWNATLNSVAIGSLNSIKLSAGAGAGGQIGDVYYDEVRVARSWTALMKLTQPVATNFSINGGSNVTDGQITGGTYSVVFDFYDTAGMSNSATLPNFDIWNSTGTRILTNRAFSSIVYSDSGRSQRASNTSHAGASGSAVVLGVYTSAWTAINSNGVQISNSTSLSNGTVTAFTVVDDDTSAPVHSNFTGMGRNLGGATFTNVEFTAGLVVTGLVRDAESGVYGGTSNRWTLFRDGTTVNSGNFTALFADGTAISSNGQLTASIDASNFTITGSYTLRVFSVNYDIDRPGDAESVTNDFAFTVRAPTITLSTSTLAFSNLLETATSGNLSYTIVGTNLVGNISVTSPPPFEISTNASTGFGNSLVLTQSAGVVSSRSLFVRFRPEVPGDATLSTSILHTASGAITQTVTASGTVLDRPNAQDNSTANTTAALLGDTVTLRIDAFQTWRSNNRSFATVFGRYDNADLTAGTVQGTGVDPGFAADLVTAATPQLTNTGTFYWAMRISYQAGNDFYYDALRATWADMSITLPSSSPLAITVSPLTAPSPVSIAVDSANRATRIDLSWTRWNSRNVLITRATATPSGSPTQGTSYSAGQSFGNQTVIAGSDAGSSTEVTGLTPGTTYFFSIYSENNGYYSTGATFAATATEMPRAQNASGGSPQQPANIYLGDTNLTFGFDSWGQIESSSGAARLWLRYTNADVSGGTASAWGSTVSVDNKTIQSGQLNATGTWYWGMQMDYGVTYGTNFWYKSSQATWAQMSSNGLASSLSFTVQPLVAASPGVIAVDSVNSATRIDLNWTPWNSKNVLITRATAVPSGSPAQGTLYSAGQTFGNQTVVNGSLGGTSLEVTNLLPGTTYYFSIYSENFSYYSTGATFAATATEMPRARNLNGAATPSQPSTIFLGDSAQAFAFDSWGVIEANFGQPFLWLRSANADLPGGTRFSGAGFTNINPKTVNSGTFNATGTWYWGMQMDYGSPYGTNFWYKNSSTTWAQMSSDGLGSTLSVTVSPINDPSGQTAVSNGFGRIDVSWTRNEQTHNVMVLRKTSAQSWTEPTQGVAYTNNQAIGSGIVVYNGSLTSASSTGLVGGTTYDFKFYSVNNNYYSPGVTAQATTIKDAQSGVTGTLSGSNIYSQGSVTITASGGQGTGAYDFRQNGGNGEVSFSGTGSNRTISGTSFGTAVIEVMRFGDSNFSDSSWVVAGTVTVQRGYFNDWEATSNLTVTTGGNLTAYGITWRLTNATANSASTAVKNGTRAATVNQAGIVWMLDPKRGGVSNLSFNIANSAGAGPDLTVQYSTNGTTWTDVITAQAISSLTFVNISTNILIPGDVYIRFLEVSGKARSFILDDILLTDFAPDLFVLGTNGQVVANGSVTTTSTNGTDFGVVAFPGTISVTNTFSITNSGNSALLISGVTTSSAMGAAADFNVLSWPTRVEAGTRSNLLVRFDPSAGGVRTAVVAIANNDIYKTNYTFVLSGTGAEPEIGVSGNGVDITNSDATPSLTDHTDFGSTNVASGTIARIYTITNSGTFTLTNSTVTIGGTHSNDFSVTVQPASSVAAGSSTTFTVTFDPSVFGTRSATVSFGNNDANENPFNFSIQGTGLAPEIDVRGNGVSIANGDATPSAADHTDFGSADILFDTVTRTFLITNAGNSSLTLGNVTTSGTHAAEFQIISQPASPVAAGGTTSVQVVFNPTATGVRSASISFATDDPDENPYAFSIQGTGTVTQEIAVLGTNGALIADGTTTSDAARGTDFGSSMVVGGTVDRTFAITNLGSGPLTITGVTTGGAHAADFVIVSFPGTVAAQTVSNFVVRFDPTAFGGRTATVVIANNDADEASYDFVVTGTGLAPEIDVLGNGQSITNNDAVPSTADHTDFGPADFVFDTVTRTFTITNTGNSDLTLGSVTTSGTHAAEFAVIQQPVSTVTAGSSTTFQVRFDPVTNGLRTAVLTFTNNDPNENPYVFTVQGTGTSTPEIAVLGTNFAEIASGATATSAGNGTDFGSQSALSGFVERTFFVTNSGSAALSITGVTTSGAHASEFIVQSFPTNLSPFTVGNLVVRFDPVNSGGKTAVVTIANNDLNESSYTFTVTGTGLNTATVATATSGSITPFTALVGGNVTDDGGLTVTNRGIVFNTTGSPTMADTVVNTNGGTTGAFSTSMTNLTPGQTYFYRAFAQNSLGTSYGGVSNFTAACFDQVVTGLTITATNFYDFTASWSALAGAQSYQVDVSSNSSFFTIPTPVNLFNFDFASPNFLNALTVDSAVTVSPVSVTSGSILTNVTTGAYFNLEPYIESSGGWNASVASTAKAYQVTMAPTAGQSFTITGIHFHVYSETNGPSALSVNIGNSSATFTTNLAATNFLSFERGVTNVSMRTNAVTILIQGWTNGSRVTTGQGLLKIDEFRVSGFTTPVDPNIPGYSNRTVIGTSIMVTGLNHTAEYFIRVRAAGGGTCASDNSATQSVVTPTPPAPPIMGPASVASVGQNTATMTGEITSQERSPILSRGFAWGTSIDPTGNEITEGGTATGVFSQARSGIPSGNFIYYRAWASNALGKTYSTNGTFWTFSAPPGLQTAQNIEAFQFDAAWFSAVGATNYFIDVSTVTNFATFIPDFSNRTTEGATSITVSNLDPVTVYYYRVRSENPAGIGNNSAVGSTTTLPTLPTVISRAVSNVLIVSASGEGEVVADGGATVTSRGFVFGTNTAPTVADSIVRSGTGLDIYTVAFSNLTPNTIYYARAFASNSVGAAYGGEIQFTTLCFTNAPTLQPARPIGANAFMANWQVMPGASDYLLDVSTNAVFGGPGRRVGNMVTYGFDSQSSPVFIGPNTIDSAFTASVVTLSRDTLSTNVTTSTGSSLPNLPFVRSSLNWTSTVMTNAKHFAFTIFPRAGEYITITNFSFRAVADNKGPTGVGFEIGNGTFSFSTNTAANNAVLAVSRAVTNLNNITNPVVVRVFGWMNGSAGGGRDGTGSLAVDDFQVQGTTGIDPNFIPGYGGLQVFTNSMLVTGLTFNSTYYLRLRAETDSGCVSAYSTTQTIVTAGSPTLSGFAIRGTGAGNAITDGDVRFGGYTITGSLFEAVAGISVSNALAPRYVILNSSGAVAVATNFFTTPFTNGAIGPVVVTGTGATGTYANIFLGAYTSRIFATTAGYGDPSATTTVAFTISDDDTNAPAIGGFSLPGGTSDFNFNNLTTAFTGTVTDASGFGTGYFLLRDFAGALIQSNMLYAAGGNAVTGTMTAANMICANVYTVSVFVVDADDDRAGDTLSASNLNAFVVNAIGSGGGENNYPVASNATVNAVILSNNTSQTLTDANIFNGGWSAGIWLSHPDSLYTNADTPSLTVRNSNGDNVINQMKLTNISENIYTGGKTFMMTNDNLPAVSYTNVTLGSYSLLWSASNVSACIAVVLDRGVMANGTNVFRVIDDDTNGPSASGFQIPGGQRTVDVSVALSGFAITGLVSDATSGIGFTSTPPYLLLLNTDGSVLASNRYTAGTEGAGLSSGASVTGWLSGAVLSCGNSYTVRVVVADADNDRVGDAASASTNVFSFFARGPGGTPPTASNLLINNTNALTATLLDSQVATGGWSVAMTISHGTLALATGTAPPTFSIRNSTGAVPYTAGSFGWSNSGGTSLSRTFTNTFIPAGLTNLITTGSYSIVWSAETDGTCYGLATSNTTVSPGTNTFTVNDDDATGPAFTGLRAGPATVGVNCPDASRTNLSAGDIAIVALNQASPADGFAFVNTVDIPSGTTLTFTDNGWQSGALTLRTNEGALTWRATNCMAAGTITRWQANLNPAFSRGSLVSSNGNFSFPLNSGDQLLVYQGPANNPAFIYALNNNQSNASWDVDSQNVFSSALPPGLLNGFSAIALPRVDHVAVNTSVVAIAGQRTEVLSFISSRTNWISSAATGYDLNALPYTFPRLSNTVNSITDEQLRNGGWTITGLVQDTQSGLLATGDGAPRFALIGANGSTVLASNNFSVTFTNGTVASQRLNATAAALDFNLVYSGVSTVRVFAADADSDRVNDSASSTASVELDVRDDDSDPPQIANFLINGKTLITDPNELSSAVISGQVRDVTSGIAFSSAPPSYVVFNALGVGVSTGTFINLPTNDGGATNFLSIRTASLNLVGIADCGTYTVRVTVADADFDHPADRLQTNLSFVINVAGAGGDAPQASDFLVDNQAAGVATVSDAQLASGAWVSSLRVQHPEGLYTEQPFLPSFRVVNPSSMIVLEGDWDSVTPLNDSLFLTNNSHASVAYESTQLGIHRLSWFARNFGACFAQTGFVSIITGGTNTFNVTDDDNVGPVPVTNISWTASSWTNSTLITLSWTNDSFSDPSGVGTYRLLTNAGQSPGLTNGRALGASFSTVITNNTEGITTNWLFAIDTDNDRANDTAAGVSTAIVMRLDFTAPPTVSAVNAPSENGLPVGVEDELTQAIVRWTPASASESVAAGAPVGRSLSPFKTYRVYYTENSLNNRWPDTSDDYFELSDGFTDLGNYASTNVLLTGLTPGTEYRFAIAGVDTAGNIGSFANASGPVRTRMLTITNIVVNEQNGVELYWAGAGEANYDVIFADGMGFTNGINGIWRLAGTVQTNVFVDTGAADRVAPINLSNRMMRFYRVAPANAWVPSQDRDGVASSNVVAVAKYNLQSGQNILGIGVLPMSNTMANVFGRQRMPSQSGNASASLNSTIYIYRNSANFSTESSWYNLRKTGASNQWVYTTNGSTWVNANDLPAPLFDALGIDVPEATSLLVAGMPVIAPEPAAMTKSITTGQLNAVTFSFSAPVPIKDIPDLRTKSQGYFSLARADLILVLNNNVNPPSVSKVMYRNSNDNKFYYSTGGSAENHELAPGESIVIRTSPRSATLGARSNFTIDLTPSSAVLSALPQPTTRITNNISARPLVNRLEHSVFANSVELRGRINPNRLVTDYWFKFGSSTNYGYTSPVITLPATNITLTVTNPISGALASGNYYFELTASNAMGVSSASASFFAGCPPISITNTSFPPLQVGSNYMVQLNATGGVPPYAYSLLSGNMHGLVLSTNGLITGTATTTNMNFSVRVMDSFGCNGSRSIAIGTSN